jgi:nuclear transcription factor Y, alpha
MMSFKGHEGFGQVAAAGAGSQAASHGGAGPLPWWAGPQLLFGEPAPPSPEETRRDAQFQVVPGAQGTPDPAPPKTGTPEVLKFSVFQGDSLFIFLLLLLLLLLLFVKLWITRNG